MVSTAGMGGGSASFYLWEPGAKAEAATAGVGVGVGATASVIVVDASDSTILNSFRNAPLLDGYLCYLPWNSGSLVTVKPTPSPQALPYLSSARSPSWIFQSRFINTSLQRYECFILYMCDVVTTLD